MWPFNEAFVEANSHYDEQIEEVKGREQQQQQQQQICAEEILPCDEQKCETITSPHEALEARVSIIEKENKKLRSALESERQSVERWTLFSEEIFNSIVLSANACDFYKRLATGILREGLEAVSLDVQFVQCSFPSTILNAPNVELVTFESLSDSLWNITWAPLWKIDLGVSGKKALIPYNTLVEVSQFHIRGSIKLSLAHDLSELTISFIQKPEIAMALESSLRVANSVPVPLRNVIESAIRTAIDTWIVENLVAPHRTTVRMDRLIKKNTLTANDIAAAQQAAQVAAEIARSRV